MKHLFTSLSLFALLFSYGQCNPATEKMMVIGDSWAFFSWSGNSYNENLDRFGFSDVECYSTTGLAVNGAEASDYFTDPARVQELKDYINSNPDLKWVHYSLGGNDAMATWHKDMNAAEEGAVLDTIMMDIKAGIDTIHATNPDLKIIIAGYDFANFSETIETLPAVAQPFHPFYGTWDGMGQPTITEINTILTTASDRFTDSSLVWENVFFVNNLGLMQYEYGQINNLQVDPYGTYPQYTAPVPGGIMDYPTPLDALNFGGNDSFHLNDAAYELFIKRHFREYYWKELRDYHHTVAANNANENASLTATTQNSTSLRLGNDYVDDSDVLLSFNTSTFDDSYVLDGASLFIEIDTVSGASLEGIDVDVSIAAGFFGGAITVESTDYAAAGDETATLCAYGTLEEEGHWMRIDLPTSFYDHIDMNGTTQFKLSYTLADTNQFIDFKNIQDNAWLDVRYTENPHVNVEEQVSEQPMSVYPNPTNGWIKFDFDGQVNSIEVYDLSGKLVHLEMINDNTANLGHLRNGMYVIKTHTNKGVEVVKLLIEGH